MIEADLELAEGFVLADKPEGLGSAALVGRLKYELKQRAVSRGATGDNRKIRVGHTGTLDRFASGLMLLLTGRATSLADQFLHADKGYIGRFQFGAFTDTHDSQGQVTSSVPMADVQRFLESERERITRAVLAIREATRQQPPLYSALKQEGRRFSDRARAGETQMPAERNIEVYDVQLTGYDLSAGVLEIDLHVSGGTYIRAFARDLSRELDFPIHLSGLRRYRLGQHVLPAPGPSDQSSLPPIWRPLFHDRNPSPEPEIQFERDPDPAPVVRDIRQALPDWPRLQVPASQATAVLSGRFLDPGPLPEGSQADFFIETTPGSESDSPSNPAGTLLAWARVTRPGSYKYMRVFG